MSGEIMDCDLNKLNRQLKCANRCVLLLMYNAGCHPPELKDSYSNIKIFFLPANTTYKLQPLDLGIMKNFKVHYRKLVLWYIVAKIDQHSLTSDVTNNVNILQAIWWIAEAWKWVTSKTIKKCFRKAGVLDQGFMIR